MSNILDRIAADPVGSAAYFLGGSVFVGLTRLVGEIPDYAEQKARLAEDQKTQVLFRELRNQNLRNIGSYLKKASEINERKWQIVNGFFELIPIIGPLILMTINYFFADTEKDPRDGDIRAASLRAIEDSGVDQCYTSNKVALDQMEAERKQTKSDYQYWSGRFQFNAPYLNH